jgi:hypothetical protein
MEAAQSRPSFSWQVEQGTTTWLTWCGKPAPKPWWQSVHCSERCTELSRTAPVT